MKKDIQILIIPDVHGRTFWKDAVAAHPDVPTVFLGDYLDQYAQEKITDRETMDVFKEILAHRKAHPDTVHLLLGNHDLAYVDKVIGDSRYIFLDIDGVVTTGRMGYWFDPECFARLGCILDRTGADIVITSSWKGLDVKETIGYLTDTRDPHVGNKPFPFPGRIVGVTKDWPVLDDDCTRGQEVDAYLKHHSCRSYAIIDDVQDFLPEQQAFFVQTKDSTGIDDRAVDDACRILLAV